MTAVTGLLLLLLAAICGLRIHLGRRDRRYIRQFIEAQGNEFLDLKLLPFGTSFPCFSLTRIYRLRYRDREGIVHTTLCEAGLLKPYSLDPDRVLVPPQEKRPGQR